MGGWGEGGGCLVQPHGSGDTPVHSVPASIEFCSSRLGVGTNGHVAQSISGRLLGMHAGVCERAFQGIGTPSRAQRDIHGAVHCLETRRKHRQHFIGCDSRKADERVHRHHASSIIARNATGGAVSANCFHRGLRV